MKFAVGAAMLLLASAKIAQATPYASCVSTNAGVVSFILNESADSVKIIFDGGGLGNTNDLGAIPRGTTNFTLGVHTSWQIQVTKSTAATWSRISDNTNKYNQYWGPSGLAVNRNPSDLTRFGRVYVAESAGGGSTTFGARTDQQGIYVVNPDFTDCLGYDDTAQTAGIFFQPGDTGALGDGRKSPWRLEIGQDNFLYISDWSTNNGNLFRMNLDLTTGETVFAGSGYLSWDPTVHTTISSSAIAKGSQLNNNLQIWAVDGRTTSGQFNRLMRWDINGASLPYNSPPTPLRSAGVPSVADISADLDIAPDGKFFLTSFRAAGPTPNLYEADRVNIRVVDTDGLTVLWDSLSNSLAIGQSADIFVNSRSVAVSPDNKKVAITKNDTHVWVMNLTNGIPDISTRTNITAFVNGADAPYTSSSTTAGDRRDIAFDAAGNFYTANQNVEVVVVWSPGGTKTAITKSDGTFELTAPEVLVSAVATGATANEAGPVDGQFTLTRVGDTSGALPVTYTLGGTASNGLDYATLSGTVTFAPGASTTNISVTVSNDTIPEFTETVILNVTSGAGYGIGGGPATVSIIDDEPAEISGSTGATNELLESYAPSKAAAAFVRRGLLNTNLSVNLSYSGSATFGVDFNGPTTISFPAGVSTASITLTPINDQIYEGDEFAVIGVAAGTGYDAGATATRVKIIDDETAVGTVLFSDDFNGVNSSNLWRINLADPTDGFVDFNWDYLTLAGIPIAPATIDGSTKGIRMQCGNVVPQFSAVSVSPTNGIFTGDYRLKFDMWFNYNGPMPDGGAGSTQHFDAGVGTAGDQTIWYNNPSSDGVWFTCSGDGADGATFGDYSAFIGAVNQNETTGFYAAGTGPANSGIRDHLNPFYTSRWGGQTAPAAQISLYSGQTGVVNLGNAGMAWHSVVISKTTNVVVWAMDGVVIATVTNDPSAYSPNIFVGIQDRFAVTISDKPEMSFALVDNLRVESYVATPPTPPASISITTIAIVSGNVEVTFTGPANLTASAFKLQSSGTVNGTYVDDNGATPSDPSPGVFKFSTALNGLNRFYRIKL